VRLQLPGGACGQQRLSAVRARAQRLATGDWFTSRVSACGLLATAYRRAPTALRTELRNLYRDLTHDETPMVRRAAAANLSKFAEAVEPEYVSKELTAIFHELTQDGKSSIWFLLQRASNLLTNLLWTLG